MAINGVYFSPTQLQTLAYYVDDFGFMWVGPYQNCYYRFEGKFTANGDPIWKARCRNQQKDWERISFERVFEALALHWFDSVNRSNNQQNE